MASWSGLYDNKYGVPYALQFPKDKAHRNRVALEFLKRSGKSDLALINVLLGAVAGTTATATYTRVKANANGPSDIMQNGGKVTVETKTIISRASTSADVTELLAYMFNLSHNLTRINDSSGNGIKGDPTRFY